jgi:hypothetical protein
MFKAAILALAFVATPALSVSHYHAQPVVSPSATKIVLRDTLWKCSDAGCIGTRSSSRPAIVCAVLVREVGRLSSFAEQGRALSAEELEKCNARAK